MIHAVPVFVAIFACLTAAGYLAADIYSAFAREEERRP